MVCVISHYVTEGRLAEVTMDSLPRVGDILWLGSLDDRVNVVVQQICNWVIEPSYHKACVMVTYLEED